MMYNNNDLLNGWEGGRVNVQPISITCKESVT